MSNQIIQLIDQQIAELRDLNLKVKYVDRKLTELYRERAKAERALDTKTTAPREDVEAEFKRVAPGILLKHLTTAYATNKEFDHEKFRPRLEQAVNDLRTYHLVDVEGKLTVVIDLDTTAGSLEDYYNAVRQVRETVGDRARGKQLPPPDLAAFMWMEKYYKPAREGTSVPRPAKRKTIRKPDAIRDDEFRAKYWATIDARIAAMQTLAPWWRLINDGIVPILGDKKWAKWVPGTKAKPGYATGGSNVKPYPLAKPTRFVQKAEAELQKIVGNQTSGISEEAKVALRNLLAKLDEAIAYLENIVFEVEDPRQEVLSMLERQLGERYSRADQSKLNQLADDIIAGVDVGRRRLGGKDVRIRTQEIQNVISEYNMRRRR